MIVNRFFRAAANPQSLRELALGHSMLSALAVNALTGILLLALVFLPLIDTVSLPLVVLLVVLFGPFTSLLASTLYPLIEYWVGHKMGSKATFDDLYRIFAWSFFPVGPAGILSGLAIIILQNSPEDIPHPAALIPLLLVCCFSLFSYGCNAIAVHHLPKTKGVAILLIAFILFVFIPTALLAIVLIIVQGGQQYLARFQKIETTAREGIFTGFRIAGIVIALFYTLLFFWIVLYDEDLEPPVAKALSTPQPEIFYPGNAWPALIAFTSSAKGPPFAEVEKWLVAIKNAFLKNANTSCDEVTPAKQQEQLSFLGKIPDLYRQKKDGFRQYASTHPAEINRLIRDNARLLSRYNAFYGYQQYTEPLDCGYCTPLPQFSPIRDTQKVKLLQSALAAQQGNIRGALLDVQKDAEFWRRIARDSKTLIAKLVSLSLLSADLRFTAELGIQQLDHDELQIVQDILRPFDQGETSFAATLEGEALHSLLSFKAISHAAQLDPLIYSALLKNNASRNRMYADYQKSIALSNMNPRNFTSSAEMTDNGTVQIRNLALLYNPVGEILNGVAKPNVAGYIRKGHATECLRRLAWLKIKAQNEAVAPEDMPQFLGTHKAAYGNPYTGEPMNWDAEKQRIFMQQPSRETDLEIYME